MPNRVLRIPASISKLVLRATGWCIVAAVALFGLVDAAPSQAQSPAAENKSEGIADTWQGTLHIGRDLRNVVKISKADDGGYKAVFYFIDQSGGNGFTASKVTREGPILKMILPDATYEGKLSLDGKTITGACDPGIQLKSYDFYPRHAGDRMGHSTISIQTIADGGGCRSKLRSRHHQAKPS
jgi:hypothetical protein